MAYVYQHIRLDTNEVFYVGISRDSNYNRAYSFKNRNKYWNNIVKKYGYKVEIVFNNILKEEAIEKEKELIKFYGRKDLNEGILANMTDGGEGSQNLSEESKQKIASHFIGKKIPDHHTKNPDVKRILSEKIKGSKNPACRPEIAKKISEAKKGKKNSKNSEFAKQRTGEKNPFYGKTHTEKHKEKMRQLKTGVPLSESHKENLKLAMLNKLPYDYKDKQQTCPYCGLVGGGGNMKRYHFDNCKSLKI
jgi:hypothetical protein